MTDNDILINLKTSLMISAEAYDPFLLNLISAARSAIETEGITIADEPSIEDSMLIMSYAEYLYNSRKENVPMPRHLRWRLNNRLFSEKARPEPEDDPEDGGTGDGG